MALSKVLDYIKRANGRATDLSHILYGFITAIVPDFSVKVLMVAVYFAYQLFEWHVRVKRLEHWDYEMKELVGDMREFLTGFTLGIVVHYKLDVPL